MSQPRAFSTARAGSPAWRRSHRASSLPLSRSYDQDDVSWDGSFIVSRCWEDLAVFRGSRGNLHPLAGLPYHVMALARLADFERETSRELDLVDDMSAEWHHRLNGRIETTCRDNAQLLGADRDHNLAAVDKARAWRYVQAKPARQRDAGNAPGFAELA